MTPKELLQGAAFVVGGYGWWAAFKHKWDDIFPTAVAGSEPTPGIVRRDTGGRCDYCGKPTSWFDIVLEKYVCSIECRTMATRALQRKLDELTQREIGHL
jgi:hypothetical protein